MECAQASNAEKCPCTYVNCERHGACCKCIAYHRPKGQMVGCYFSPEAEKSYDRSMAKFLSQFNPDYS